LYRQSLWPFTERRNTWREEREAAITAVLAGRILGGGAYFDDGKKA
jgi:hypothetical protein